MSYHLSTVASPPPRAHSDNHNARHPAAASRLSGLTRGRVGGILLAQTALVSVLGGVGIAASPLLLHVNGAVFLASTLVFSVVVWSLYSWRLTGRALFGPYGLFLISASAFNGGAAILEVLGLNVNGVLGGVLPEELTTKALYMVALGLAALHLGAIWAISKAPESFRFPTPPPGEDRNQQSRLIGLVFLLLAAIPAFLVLKDVVSTIGIGGYRALYGRPEAETLSSGIRTMAPAMIPGVMFMAAGCTKRGFLIKVLWIIMLVWTGVWMWAGMRHEAVPFLLAFVWLYDCRVRRIPRLVVGVAGVLLLVVFTFVALVRNDRDSVHDSINEAREASDLRNNPAIGAISEMGATLYTVALTIDLIPSVRPFDHGLGYAYAILRVLPNVGRGVHPAAAADVAHGAYGDWLTQTIDPNTRKQGGGYGYSFFAEAFANFGWLGLVPVLTLTGYLLARMNDWGTQSRDPARCAAVATFMVWLLFFPRDESLALARPFLYYTVLPYAAVGLLHRHSKALRILRGSPNCKASNAGTF